MAYAFNAVTVKKENTVSNSYDYDLNIFQQELISENEWGDLSFEYGGPWYIDIYNVLGSGHTHVLGPIELTKQEARLLDLGRGYFDEGDCWYGLDGFLKDYQDYISPRLIEIFEKLPRDHKELV